jgi:uncharacterized membrane protein HdeD (DUF308 family)
MVLGIASSGSLIIGILAILFGILVLAFPKFLRIFLGAYLIIAGILAILV